MTSSKEHAHFYTSRFLILLCIFIITGLALMFSLSYSFSLQSGRALDGQVFHHSGVLRLFLKQLISTVIGLLGIYAILKMKTDFIRKASFICCVFGLVCMVWTVFFGTSINGARRWLTIAGMSIQTGDFMRIAFIVYASHIFAQFHTLTLRNISDDEMIHVKYKLMMRSAITTVVYMGSLYLQRDYTSLILTAIIALLIIFSSEIQVLIKFAVLMLVISVLMFVILNNPNRMERILMFFSPSNDVFDLGFQLNQSYELIANSGLVGRGIGGSMIDALSLPYFYNDFVFAIIISEMGLLGVLCVIVLFMLMLYYAYKVCYILYYKNRFYFYVVFSSATFIVFSAFLHIAVTVGIVPTAGLNLPFYSTGGSSLVTTLFLYGFILKGSLATDKKHYSGYPHRVGYSPAENTEPIGALLCDATTNQDSPSVRSMP